MTELPEGYHYLQSDDVQKRQSVLRAIAHRPTGDPRVLPHIEQMLEDRRPGVMSLPAVYGEVCLAAAEALAAERKAQGIIERVRVSRVVIPLTHNQLAGLAKAAGLPSTMGWGEWFERLRETGLLPVEDLDLEPGVLVS
jgi:hypothetical protein